MPDVNGPAATRQHQEPEDAGTWPLSVVRRQWRAAKEERGVRRLMTWVLIGLEVLVGIVLIALLIL